MAMKHFERITTEYAEVQDRIGMAVVLSDGEVVQAWFTQRLLLRLVPVLLQWLQAQDASVPKSNVLRAEVMQGFAQQAARARLPRQPPVQPVSGDAQWLIHVVEVVQHPQTVRLIFKGMCDAGPNVAVLGALTLAPEPLRQWLNILHDNFCKGGWPLQVWPEWVTESAPASASGSPVLLH